MSANPELRECPWEGCGHTQHGTRLKPNIVCHKCRREYCFLHSNAHPNSTCVTYFLNNCLLFFFCLSV